MTFVATCAPSLEGALARELADHGLEGLEEGHRAVRFNGSLEAAYRACLWSRVATRVLAPVGRCYAADARALYAELRKIRWDEHLDPDRSLAVTVVGTNAALRNTQFTARKVKDAVCDDLRHRCGRRPDVDLDTPDVRVHVALRRRRATVSIDLSGEPLHLRGHGRDGGPAPLKETLAAGILWLAGAGQRGDERPLVDPFCGSGTLLIEAASMRRDVAPGLSRSRWGFAGWRRHDAALWQRLVDEARERRRPAGEVTLFGGDRDPDQVRRARDHAERAGVGGDLRFAERSLARWEPPASHPGLVVSNPPHGERVGEPEQVEALWRRLGDVLRQRFPGWTAWLLAGSPQLAKHLGLRPRQRITVYNGALEGRLLEVPIADRPPERLR